MPYTTNQLITDAYYASDVVSREMETVSGSQIQNALRWLNEVLGKKVVEPSLIPYQGETTFTAVIGQEDYFIPDLIKIDILTFLLENVRYAMRFTQRNEYRGSYRVETITTLPYQYFYERTLGGCNVSVYFLPDRAYNFTITGIFRLNNIALGDDLETSLDAFYISYLKYALAVKICTEYAMPVPAQTANELREYNALISKQSRPLDLSINKVSTLQSRPSINWAFINFNTGFVP